MTYIASPTTITVANAETGLAKDTTLSTLNGKLPSGLTVTANRLQVELPSGGTGLTNTELRATAVPVSGTVTVSNPTTNPETGLAKDGTDITTPTAMPAGGSGIRGWLSAIWTKLNGSLSVTGTFWQATQPVSIASMPTTPVTGTFFQATQPVSLATNTPVIAAGTNTIGNINELRASTLSVTVTAATGVAATLTLPAVVGQFHYITSLQIRIYATAARTGSATPVIVTTTNLPGSPAFTFETAQAIGTTTPVQGFTLTTPLRSTVANTATTIVAPIATAGIWRITATYFTAT